MPQKDDDDDGGKRKRIRLDGPKGSGVTIASDMDVQTACGIVNALMEKEEIVGVQHHVEADRYDAALAMLRVGDLLFEGGMRPHRTQTIAVEVDVDKTVDLEWGCYTVPSVPGLHIDMDYNFVRGAMVFTLLAKVKRKDAKQVEMLADSIRKDLKRNSIYRNKTVQLEFRDEDGDRIRAPRVSFFPASGQDPIMHPETAADINCDVFVPLKYPEQAAKGGNSRRGIMLAGEYGLGKTMQAAMVARFATDNGWTFFYLKDSRDIVNAMRYVHRSLPAVLFVEDIDRAVGRLKDPESGDYIEDRDDGTQGIMNDIDSIGGKDDRLMLIMSTNHLGEVHPGMLRPGRTDAIINVKRPDAGAAMGLVTLYAQDELCPDIDPLEVGKRLEGRTPAEIKEIVAKARLFAIDESGGGDIVITGDSLLKGAARFDRQRTKTTVSGAQTEHQTLPNGRDHGGAATHPQ